MQAMLLATLTWMVLPPAAESAHFQRDIRPILSNRCFTCHGPDEESREADLRLDLYEEAIRDRDGYQVIRPGDPQASELVRRVSSADDDRMPPPEHGTPLTEQEIALLTDWIRSGAAYDQHWAFRPVQRPKLPELSGDWPRNAIDMFVLAAQRRAGLEPSPAADRRTLIRRVYLDVLGLLPTPEQVQAFVDDSRPDAYQRLVERVLSSPHYGERWGRHWLDQARYADTNGYTIDSERSIWLYRDWVVRALNDDLPFDQFTIEQLAGDLLPHPSTSQLVATGFHRNTLVNQEGGTDREQFRVEVAMDRVDTTGTVWLGLTVGCARCHHHKFDPISQREYYQLYAFFNSAQDANSVDPTVSVPSDADAVQLKELNEQLAVAQRALREYDQALQQQLPEPERNDGKPIQWTVVRPAATSTAGDTALTPLDDGSLLATGANAAQEDYKILWMAEPGRMTAVRLEALTHPSLPKGGPGRAENGNFVLNEVQLQSETDQPPVAWIHATADHSQKDYPVTAAIDGDPQTGWAINGSSGSLNQNRTAVFVLAEPLQIQEATAIELRLVFGPTPPHYNLGRFRVSVSDSATTKFNLPDARRSQLAAEVEQRRQAVNQFSKRIPTTMVMRDLPQPRKSHLLIRGDFLRPGEEVRPDVPAVLPALTTEDAAEQETPSAHHYGRLDLARWLVREDHPLTGRVLVNRIWMHYFGQGLVETENDFGIQSSLPTHPELLDWLAAELVDQGWSLKHLHRLILASATYRQSSRHRSDVAQIDPRNQWLARQNRLRVDAEIVRDLALCASGLLEDRVGGPSVYPPQPAGVYAFTQRQANWPTSRGADRYRRGLYTFFMRSAPFPMMTTFDAPRFNTTCTRRGRSNTPLQSLTMANDQALVEMSQAFARRALDKQIQSDQERLSWMFEVCMARNPQGDELALLNRYLDQTREELAGDAAAARQLAGIAADDPRDAVALGCWTAVARLLINLDEFLNRE